MADLDLSGLAGHSVLVTGGHGLLGSWLVRALVQAGARVVVIRRDEPTLSSLELLGLAREVATVRGDICETGLVDRALAEYEVESVFHLAAQTIVETAYRSPVSTFETNVRGTWIVLEAARRAGAARVIVASSDKAYGRQEALPYREDQPLLAQHPYDVSKAACDLIARSYWSAFGLPVAVTRFANLYGGAETNRSRLIPEAICAALGGRPAVLRSDGTPERDFLYVEDAARAYLAIWEALGRREGAGEAFNAGSGKPRRVRDVVDLIFALAGTHADPEIRGQGTPAGEIARQWVDFGKLRRLTGWEPQVGLEEGLERTLAWYRGHPQVCQALGPF